MSPLFSRHFARLALAVAPALLAGHAGAADDGFWDWLRSIDRHKEVAAVSLKAYQDECSSCHYAYPPGLLPAASWQKLLAPAALEKHFGENIEMKEAQRTALLAYAMDKAADRSYTKRSRKIMASLAVAGADPAPERITETAYIRRKHQDIPARLIKDNPEVKALSQCDTCHTQAKTGNLDDGTVFIPGHGRW